MEQRNMLLAFALSMVILVGWSVMFPKDKTAKSHVPAITASQKSGSEAPTPPGSVQPAPQHAQAAMPKNSSEALVGAAGMKPRKRGLSAEMTAGATLAA